MHVNRTYKKVEKFWVLFSVIIILIPAGYSASADIAAPPSSYSPVWLTPTTLLQYEVVSQSRPDESQDYVVNHSLMNISIDLITPRSVYYTKTVTPADGPNKTPVSGSSQWNYGDAADPCFYVDPADFSNSVLSPDGRPYSVANGSYSGQGTDHQETLVRIETKHDPVNTTYAVIFGKETGYVYEFSSVSADKNHRKEITLLSDS